MEKKAGFMGKTIMFTLISYLTTKNLLLHRKLTGGEWTGQEGFGLLLNHTWPFEWEGQVVTRERIWIEFSPRSLISTITDKEVMRLK